MSAAPWTRLTRQGTFAALMVFLSLALYWPLGTWFQGDDFLAITYAHQPANIGYDFFGPQYHLTGHTLFWRPLITLSFGLESWLFGSNSFGYHLNNTLVHGLNTLLLLLILTRVIGRDWAQRATFLWAIHPALALPVMWTVGRVDIHVIFWLLLAIFLFFRRRSGWPGFTLPLLAFMGALATKEQAIILPPLLLLLAWKQHKQSGLRIDSALVKALVEALPFFLVLVPYFLLRYLLLGKIVGGYTAEQTDLSLIPQGIYLWTTRLLAPLGTWLGSRTFLGDSALWYARIILLAWFIWTILALRHRKNVKTFWGLLVGIFWFLGTCVPIYSFIADFQELKHFRYFYLALAGLMIIGAAGGWRPTLLLATLMVLPHLPLRQDFAEAYDYDRRVHIGLKTAAAQLNPEVPLVVTDDEGPAGISWKLFLGLERMLCPPFATNQPHLFRWRAFGSEHFSAWQSLRFSPAETGFAFPQFLAIDRGGDIHLQPVAGMDLPRFELTHNLPGTIDYATLYRLPFTDTYIQTKPATPGLYRVILLTGIAYMAAELPSEADGSISLRKIFLAHTSREAKGPPLMSQLAMALDVVPKKAVLMLVARLDHKTKKPVALAGAPVWLNFDDSAVRLFMGLPE